MNELQKSTILNSLDELYFTCGKTGPLVAQNQAVVEVTGYSWAELETIPPNELFDGSDALCIEEIIEKVLRTGETKLELTVVTADGEHLPYEFTVRRLPDDAPAAALWIGEDISNRKSELEMRERVLREMYEIISDREQSFAQQVQALLALGRRELNTAYGTLSKIEGDEYLFEYVDADDDSISPGDVVPVEATNCEVVANTEQTVVIGDVSRDAPEETDRAGYTDWGISCYLGAPVYVSEEVYGTFCFYDTESRLDTFSDWETTLVDLMSRWVSAELGRQQITEQLQHQNDRLERFASVLSHDIRNPLTVAMGRIEVVSEECESEHLGTIETSLTRIEALIEDTLTLTRQGNSVTETEKVDLATFIEQCWEVVDTKSATLRVDSDFQFRADPQQLQRLIENLLRNALDHGTDDVTISVGALSGNDGFYFADNGTGIPPEDRDTVFDIGFSTQTDGTGFGLAIIEDIVDAHGWNISITESNDGGARFEITGIEFVG